jgi:DNA-binding PadR family transcriptional regulator
MTSQFYRRMLSGMLPKIALEEIASAPIHGYALIVLVRKKYHVYFGPSTVFPMLNNLARDGLVASTWDLSNCRPRKVYHLTEKGKVALQNFRFEMDEASRAFVRTV